MKLEKVLGELGLSKGEIKVYLALLKLGSSPVSEIKEETNLHRTTIYDFIEKLLNKGLINYIIKNNVKHYKATHPNKLIELVKEKEEHIQNILPKLIKLTEFKKEKLRVEVYKGKEGFKTVLNDVIRTKQEFTGFGIDETYFKEKFPILMEQHFKKAKKEGIKSRVLTSESTPFIFKTTTTKYRFIPGRFFNPTPTGVYGNKVIIMIIEPLTIIMIENSNLADSYRKYFNLIWGIAKRRPKIKRLNKN